MSRGCICVFAKPPRPGTVKTRLAPVLGDEGASALAHAFLLDTWSTVTRVPGVDVVLATTEVEAPGWSSLNASGIWPQGEGTLGDRLERVLRRALEAHPFAIAIGTDSPGLPLSRLEDACEALRTTDAVIGPADDGGFYLIGVTTCPHGLLDTVPWSTAGTRARTLERLEQHHLTTTMLGPWFDVDEAVDLHALRRRIRDGTIQAPETARALGTAAATESARADEQEPPDVRQKPPGVRQEPPDVRRGPFGSAILSIVMPVLNEEARIAAQLAGLASLNGVDEIIVVDGGSADRTRELAAAAGCRVVTAPRGRGTQMNAGAAAASGDILLFLHADVTLPVDAASLIRAALADPGIVAGAFQTRTIAEGRRTWATRWLRLADLRSRYTRLPYGDQALFVRRDAFRRAGGFPAQPLFEDLELSRRLWAVGRVRTLRAEVRVSGRRFLARPLYFAVLMNVLPILYRLGVSPQTLQRAYGDVR